MNIRKILLIGSIFFISSMNVELKANDDEIEKNGSGITRKKPSKTKEVVQEEKASWTSYIPSPKCLVEGAFKVVNFAIRHPGTALTIGSILALETVAVAAQFNRCTLICNSLNGTTTRYLVDWRPE